VTIHRHPQVAVENAALRAIELPTAVRARPACAVAGPGADRHLAPEIAAEALIRSGELP
jgi:hypothetical protein